MLSPDLQFLLFILNQRYYFVISSKLHETRSHGHQTTHMKLPSTFLSTVPSSLSFVWRLPRLKTLISDMAAAREDLSSSLSEAPASFVDQSAVDDSKSKSQNDFSNSDDFEYGFQRPEMNQNALSGTVDPYDCHLFLCYKNYESWPARVEGSESDRLPRLLAAALKSRKKEIQRNVGFVLEFILNFFPQFKNFPSSFIYLFIFHLNAYVSMKCDV